MRFYRYHEKNGYGIVAKRQGDGMAYPLSPFCSQWHCVEDMLPDVPLQQINQWMQAHPEVALPLDALNLVCPFSHITNILCLSNNYPNAMGKSPGELIVFSKQVHQLRSQKSSIHLHGDLTSQVDYEAELCCIVGKDVYHADLHTAQQSIFGYAVMNDLTARDLQVAYGQWYFGKSLDDFAVMGTCMVTPEEFDLTKPHAIYSMVNGQVRQKDDTSRMIHSPAEVISQLSKGMTLRRGTVISLGTPYGCEMDRVNPIWLKPGDVVTCGVEGIGEVTVAMIP